ncbi:MAG: hypothetical protein HY862_09600 [Chloroflexi bacterium]|nr:hypothetical protein [Chloroflexota bacterium]
MKRFLMVVAVFFAATFVPMARTDAHGLGNQQLEQVEAGPYLVSVWTDPKNVTTQNNLHITISVQDHEKDFVLDADVQVKAVLVADSNITQLHTASHDNAIQKMFYEAKLRLNQTGQWHITIGIDSELGQGEASFDLRVAEASDSWTRWLWPALGVTTVLVILVFGMYRKTRSTPQGS